MSAIDGCFCADTGTFEFAVVTAFGFFAAGIASFRIGFVTAGVVFVVVATVAICVGFFVVVVAVATSVGFFVFGTVIFSVGFIAVVAFIVVVGSVAVIVRSAAVADSVRWSLVVADSTDPSARPGCGGSVSRSASTVVAPVAASLDGLQKRCSTTRGHAKNTSVAKIIVASEAFWKISAIKTRKRGSLFKVRFVWVCIKYKRGENKSGGVKAEFSVAGIDERPTTRYLRRNETPFAARRSKRSSQ
jgi:hypothetical protein